MLSTLDLLIIGAYFALMIALGWYMRNQAKKSKDAYLMGGKTLPWYMLGLSDASDMFDISGTMLLVSMAFLYGFKSVFIPWMWPVFNQIFLMVFLSRWLRRSNATTGAEWLSTRFGLNDKGVRQSHLVVVAFALILCVGYMAYAFVGVGEFLQIFLPYERVKDVLPFLSHGEAAYAVDSPEYQAALQLSKHNTAQFYGIAICLVATFYSIIGGMHGIVLADVIKYMVMIICSLFVGVIAMSHLANSGENLLSKVPLGWDTPFFGLQLGLDWGPLLKDATIKLQQDGYQLFSAVVGMMLISGIMKSLAGPAPNYDCQKILSTRSPEEAAKMSGFISVILMPIRYFMTMGFCVLGILYFSKLDLTLGTDGVINFENIMPAVISKYLPVGLIGLVLAGFLGAFMSNFSGTLNAGQAYLVNDIYLKFINPQAERKSIISMSYLSGVVMVIFGIGLGLLIKDVNMIFNIITAGLYGGFVCANVLKWYWWRFNATGYFYGMLAGIVASAIPPALSVSGITTYFDGTRMLYFFPVFIVIQLIACIIGTYAAPPTNQDTLLNFYKTVRPWGLWQPIHELAMAEDPNFERNKNFGNNMLNLFLGIVGQLLLMLLPMYLILSKWMGLGVVLALLVVVFVVMKRTWWDRLTAW
ncbi:MAG: Na+:solute symporter [Haliscomenobacter sp.]|nr:sodium:solute symporter family protein [Haliscomenobacter sp.]MBK9491721.1 Na+:solute symporter [Haliscomenobacter sp.]